MKPSLKDSPGEMNLTRTKNKIKDKQPIREPGLAVSVGIEAEARTVTEEIDLEVEKMRNKGEDVQDHTLTEMTGKGSAMTPEEENGRHLRRKFSTVVRFWRTSKSTSTRTSLRTIPSTWA